MTSDPLVEAARSGDRTAVERLLAQHYDDVARVCRRICAHPDDADDATQAALIAIARGIRSFDGTSAVTTWMYRIATNASMDELRRRKRHSDRVGVELDANPIAAERHLGAGGNVAGDVVNADTIDRMMASMSDSHRAVLVLRDAIGCDYAEIADILGIKPGTVKSQLSRARLAAVEFLNDDDANSSSGTENPSKPGTKNPSRTSNPRS